jgi:hypothetical protein
METDKHTYRHDAQPCYCGEPNCVGFLGGKTQTDLGGMDTLYLDGEFINLFVCCMKRNVLTGALVSSWYHGRGRGTWAQGLEEKEGQEARRGLQRMCLPIRPPHHRVQVG